MSQTNIEWADAVWNPVTGCSKLSAGCQHCYAEAFAHRQMGAWKGRAFTDVRCHEDRLAQPSHWKKPRRVFVNSMSDLFHPNVPAEFIGRVFNVMGRTPQHNFQVLTKRPDRMRDVLRAYYATLELDPFAHVWLGVSVENQETADTRIPALLDTPAALRFVSCEPLLGPIDLSNALPVETIGGVEMEPWLNWIIVGGESGPHARTCRIEWIEALIAQANSASVPLFVKQLGAYPVWAGANAKPEHHSHGKNADPALWPPSLRERRFPVVGETAGGRP